jgi:PAS domain S-box-containing protein
VEESAEELFEHAPCGYLSARADGTVERVNRTLLDWTGYARQSIIGRSLRDLLAPSGKLFYETHYAPLLRMQGFVREMALDLRCGNGRLLPVLLTSVQSRDASGRPGMIRTAVFDATERRVYERELMAARRRAEQLASVVESSADAIIVINPDLEVQTWNRGAERVFGYTAEEAIGRSIRDLIVPPELMGETEGSLELLRSGLQVQMDTVRVTKSGKRMEVSLGLTPHIEPPGEVIAISAIIRDITERRRVEVQLQRAEQMQSVATLAGGVAHEVNNQMAIVLGFGQFVLGALGPEHPQTGDVRSMVSAAAKAASISRQLLAFSRQMPILQQEARLGELVEGLRATLSLELGPEQSLVIESCTPDHVVRVDPVQVGQVLLELVRNARDATPPGGTITVASGAVSLDGADAEGRGDGIGEGEYAVLSVSDTGQGMDPPTLRRAFEPFFTTKPVGEGTGLGLAMVHGIVKQHGGHVWATSQPGQGTTFRVYFPVAQTPSPLRAEGA